jgi:hypothetical protein
MNLHLTCGLAILLGVVQLSACAEVPQTNQQGAQQQQEAQLQAKAREMDACCVSLFADSRLDSIRRMVPINLNYREPISVEMKGNSQFPTEDEANSILLCAQLRQECLQRHLAELGPAPTHLAALRMANSQVMAEWYARQITYGQFSGN